MPARSISFLALHGFTGSGNDFRDLVQRSQAWSLWRCPDLPAHGTQTLVRGASLLEQCHQTVLDSWNDLEVAPLKIGLGYSLGGRLWLQFLPDPHLPCDALILIGSHPGLVSEEDRKDRRNQDSHWVEILETQGIDIFLQKWKEQPLLRSQRTRIPPAIWEEMQKAAQDLDPKALAEIFRQLSPGVLPPRQDLKNLGTLPILWVAGQADPKYAHLYSELAQKFSPWKSLILPGAGHAAHLERPEDFLHGLKSFLKHTFPEL